MAVDGIAKGRQYTSKTKLGQLWTCVWDGYEACMRHGIHITVLELKSHENTQLKSPIYCRMATTVPTTMQD